MFEVEFHQENYYWYRFVFKFKTLEEAQQFIETALNHFDKEDGDEDDKEDKNLLISLRYSQKFSTAEEELNNEKEEKDR